MGHKPLTSSDPRSHAGWVRAVLYLFAMLYLFLGVNIAFPTWLEYHVGDVRATRWTGEKGCEGPNVPKKGLCVRIDLHRCGQIWMIKLHLSNVDHVKSQRFPHSAAA